MPREKILKVDITAEIDRLFDDSSIPIHGRPNAVIVMGGVATGKTTLRKHRYARGYVLIDAADIFLSLSRGEFLPFPDALQEPMELIGRLVTHQALSERRNIVTEVIGTELAQMKQLIEALKAIGYTVEISGVFCDVHEAMKRNLSRGDDDISAYYAEPFQRAWIIDACNELANAP